MPAIGAARVFDRGHGPLLKLRWFFSLNPSLALALRQQVRQPGALALLYLLLPCSRAV